LDTSRLKVTNKKPFDTAPKKSQLSHVAYVSTEQRNDTSSLLCHICSLGWIISDNISFIEIKDAFFIRNAVNSN